MHKYLRAIGFSKIQTPKQMHELVMDVIQSADKRSYTSNSDTTMLEEFSKAFAKALDEATGRDGRISGVLSTKGSL